MVSTLDIILDFVFRLVILLFLARFLLQASRADFYNPVSQAVVKATNPVCKPLRAVLRSVGPFDLASIVVAWLVAVASIVVFLLLASAPLNPLSIIVGGLIKTLLVLTQFYKWSIIIIVIASFVAQGSVHPALQLLQQLVEPLLAPLRRILPSLGPLDLSPMVVILLIFVFEDLLLRTAI